MGLAIKFSIKEEYFNRFDNIMKDGLREEIIDIIEEKGLYDRKENKYCESCKVKSGHYAVDNYVVKDRDYLGREKSREKSHTSYGCINCGNRLIHTGYDEYIRMDI